MISFARNLAICFLATAAIFGAMKPVVAQSFTTAAEVKELLNADREDWIVLREDDEHDLLYFTKLESVRCGMAEIRYAVNGEAEQVWKTEPCYRDKTLPNIQYFDGFPINLELQKKSLKTVAVTVVYSDGTQDSVNFQRDSILRP